MGTRGPKREGTTPATCARLGRSEQGRESPRTSTSCPFPPPTPSCVCHAALALSSPSAPRRRLLVSTIHLLPLPLSTIPCSPPSPTMPLSAARKDGDKERTAKSQEQELKRARGAISCAECRRLKLKCDKTVPCSSCKRRGCASICPNGSLTTGQGTRCVPVSVSS